MYRSLGNLAYFADVVPVKAGQTFYYSANIDGKDLSFTSWGDPDSWVDPSAWANLLGGTSWSAVAQKVLSGVSGVASGRVVGADRSSITLALTAKMDRASQSDLQGNVDAAVAAQSEVNRVLGSVLRLTDAGLNPDGGKPFEISPAMWAVIGIGLVLLLRR